MWTTTGNSWDNRHYEDCRFDADDDPNEHMDVPPNTIALNLATGDLLYMHADKNGKNKAWKTFGEG